MSTLDSNVRCTGLLASLACAAVLLPWAPAHAARSIEEHRSADPHGMVEVFNLAGSVEVSGWDRPEVQVSGTVDDDVERVDVSSSANRTSVNVIRRSGTHGGEARLLVRVPAASAVTATFVSSDLKLSGLTGETKLQTVSGNVSGDVGGNVHVGTVNGVVRMTAHDAHRIEIKTISGDVHVAGGGGDVEITTVSGTVKSELTTVTQGRFKSVAGDVITELGLAPDAQLEGESVSGAVSFEFAATPDAEFDVQSFSGEIHNCFGPAPTKPQYGPGSRLAFTNGAGHGRVRVDTKSGDVRLCVKGINDKGAAGYRQGATDGKGAKL